MSIDASMEIAVASFLASRQPIKQMSPPLEYSTNPKHEEKEAKDEINQKKTARISFREKTGHRLPFVDRSQHTKTGEHIQKIGVCIPAVFDETGSGATNVDTSKPAPIMSMCACISAWMYSRFYILISLLITRACI